MRTVAAAIHSQPNRTSISRSSTLFHWFASDRAAKNRTAAAKIHCASLKSLRRSSAKNLSVYPCVTARGGFRRKGRECVEAPCPAKLTSSAVAGEQIIERTGQCGPVTRFHEQSCLLVLDHVGESAGVECDHGCLAKQRFHSHQSQSLVD